MNNTIQEQAIIISYRQLSNEKCLLINCFFRENGMVSGIYFTNRIDYDIPLIADTTWSPRGDNGIFTFDPIFFLSHFSISNPMGSLLISSAIAMTNSCLPHGQKEQSLWDDIKNLISHVEETKISEKSLMIYLSFEIKLLYSQGISPENFKEHANQEKFLHRIRQTEAKKNDTSSAEIEIRSALYQTATLLTKQSLKGKLPLARMMIPKVVKRVFALQK